MHELSVLQSIDDKMTQCEALKKNAFLGYAVFNVIDPQDGGAGPMLRKNHLNTRPLSKPHIKTLVESFKAGKKSLILENHIFIGMCQTLVVYFF